MCDTCLDIISESSDNWPDKIKIQKFQWHNNEWLQLVLERNDNYENDQSDDYSESDEDMMKLASMMTLDDYNAGRI